MRTEVQLLRFIASLNDVSGAKAILTRMNRCLMIGQPEFVEW